MSNNVALDGIIAYALAKKMNDGGNEGVIIKTVNFNNEKLIITMSDNSKFEAPFSDILKHDNKIVIDKLTINENNQLLYDNVLVCDLSETIKNIILDDITNELVVTFGNETNVKIPLEPMIIDIVNEMLSDVGASSSMFLSSVVNTVDDLYEIENPQIGQTVIVEADSVKSNQRSLYVYKDENWLWIGSLTENRDFKKKPINLNTEVIGTITDAMIPNTIARVSQLHNHNNKTILDGLTENAYNELLYKGKKLSAIKITDKDNVIFNDITSFKIGSFLGQKRGDLLELKFDALSTDLKDMPQFHSEGKILVSNQRDSIYELKSIEEITDLKENYATTITTLDWGSNEGLGYYQKIITHNLNSTNLIVAFYDTQNNVKKFYDYTILNELEIAVKCDVNDECRVVINCSQGTVKNKGTGGGGSDHTHSNLPILNGFNQDKHGNLLYNGTRIFTNFNPLIYKRIWNQQLLEELSLLVDYNTIFQEQDIKIITSSEIIIENKNITTGNPNTDEENKVHLKIVEDDFVVLDVFIPINETQKYSTGINANTQIYIKGYFSGNLIINYFDTSCIQNGEDVLKNYYTKDETYKQEEVDNLLFNKQSKIDNNLTTTNKEITNAINELNEKIENGITSNLVAGNGINILDNTITVKYDNTTIGLNKKGELEAKLSTGGGDEGNTNIKQYIIKDVKSGTLYTIEDEGLPINHKLIPSVFAITTSKENIKTITDFELNIEDISSDNGIKLQDNYKLNVINYESEIVNKANFNKILGFRGGV